MKLLGDVVKKEFIFGIEPERSRRVRRVWTEPELRGYAVRWDQFSRNEWIRINPEVSKELELLYQKYKQPEESFSTEEQPEKVPLVKPTRKKKERNPP